MKKIFLSVLPIFALIFLPRFAHAATLYLSPGSGSFGVGSTITVSVRTNTQGQPVNTGEANISYSTDTLDLVKVSQGTNFYLPAPGSPSKSLGTAYFGGGVPTPGYTGSGGVLGTMTFRAKAEGEASVSVSSGKILLNDGFGTDVLTTTSGAHFTIAAAGASAPAGGIAAPVVTSKTHADPAKWYPANIVDLAWNRPANAYGFSFELNQAADTEPDNVLDTTVTTTKSYSDLKDGVYYFHIKTRAQAAASSFSPTAHFKINIDSGKPNPFEIKLVGSTVNFETTDDVSGIEIYSVWVDGLKKADQTESSLNLKDLSGKHDIKVVASDKAGNTTSVQAQIDLPAAKTANIFTRTVSIPLFMILAFNLLLFILLLFVLWLLLRGDRRSIGSGSSEIGKIQDEIDQSLEDLKLQISKKLLTLTTASSEDMFEKETAVAKDIRNGIVKTRTKIDKKISTVRKKSKVVDE